MNTDQQQATSPAITLGDRYVAVRYIGKKPSKRDTVLERRNLVWEHPGAVKWVPERDAAIYISYADIWALAPDVQTPEGGIMGLAQVAAASRPPASDPKSTNALPNGLSRKPDPPYDSDAKAENPILGELEQWIKGTEQLTVAAATTRITELLDAFPKLKAGDFGPDGKPKATAFTKVVGRTVTREERDIVWNMLKSSISKMAADSGAAVDDGGEGDAEPAGEVDLKAAEGSTAVDDLIP